VFRLEGREALSLNVVCEGGVVMQPRRGGGGGPGGGGGGGGGRIGRTSLTTAHGGDCEATEQLSTEKAEEDMTLYSVRERSLSLSLFHSLYNRVWLYFLSLAFFVRTSAPAALSFEVRADLIRKMNKEEAVLFSSIREGKAQRENELRRKRRPHFQLPWPRPLGPCSHRN
jgi:hypothetical protein